MTTDNDEIYEGRVARDEKNYPAMTHDELLARLLVTDKTNMTIEVIKWQLALRAVVELHKPNDGTIKYCEGCSNAEFLMWEDCPTIQAIEKELG